MISLRKKTVPKLPLIQMPLSPGDWKISCHDILPSARIFQNECENHDSLLSQALRQARSFLLVTLALQSGHLHGAEIVSAGPVAVKVVDTKRADDRLSPAAFAEPPVHARPGSFWDWLNGAMTKEQITRDLEAMKQGGMRGGEIWDVAAMEDPDGRIPTGPAFLGPESTQLIVHAIREADRLGLEIGIIASSGWNAGGSWIPPEYAGKGLYQSVSPVTGPQNFHAALALPELPASCLKGADGRPAYSREVAVLAVIQRDKVQDGPIARRHFPTQLAIGIHHFREVDYLVHVGQ